MKLLQRKKRNKQARDILDAGIQAVQAPRMLGRAAWQEWPRRPLDGYRQVVVLGLGKAAMAMGGVVEEQLGDRAGEGLLVVPEGYAATLPKGSPAPDSLEVVEAGHPLPNAASEEAAGRLLERASGCSEEDLLLVLVSGGGTALTFAPAEGLTQEEAQRTFQTLMEAGADIQAMNAVRKHLARLGGGQLARAAAPAEVLALAVSDVPGDDSSVVASGPTVPDPTTFEEALGVLRQHGIEKDVPEAVLDHLQRGLRQDVPETPKPGEALFERVQTRMVGSNRDALEAAQRKAEEEGYKVLLHPDVDGEAREVGRAFVREALEKTDRPLCLLGGGETTVTVQGEGKGGRNQELALAAALEMYGQRSDIEAAILLSAGTDGIDGPTDAAGALATPQTVLRARRQGIDAQSYLDNNNSYHFFDQLNGLIRTGPTHTNVMDMQVVLIG